MSTEIRKVIEKLPIDKSLIEDIQCYLSQAGNTDPEKRTTFLKGCFTKFLMRKSLLKSTDEGPVITDVFLDELTDFVYFKHIHTDKPYITTVIDPSKHKKGRTIKEREQRNSGDFKKNILPTLGRDEKLHHLKKKKLRNS